MKKLFFLFVFLSYALPVVGQTVMQNQSYSYSSTGTQFLYLSIPCGSGNQTPTPPFCAPHHAGTMIYCSDCATTVPCTGGGTGAIAQLVDSGMWQCGGGSGATSTCGVGGPPFNNLIAGPGQIQIIGNSGNGTDKISGVNVNGIANATTFAGADLGAKINSAMASLPNGGTIYIPAGSYSFSTTIQCPVTGAGSGAYIIEGAGSSMAPDHGPNANTWLFYTGSGDAINQVVTVVANQNQSGCQLRDFNLDGTNATGTPNGYHFGGTEHSAVWNVTIKNFAGAGIAIENASTGEFTERYDLQGFLWQNNIGISFVADPGGNPSFEHGYVNEYFNVPNTGVAIQLSGNAPTGDTAQISGATFIINGNIGNGTGTTATVWKLLNSAFLGPNDIYEGEECDETSCVGTNLATGTSFNSPVRYALGGGPSIFTHIGGGYYLQIPPPANHIIAASVPASVAGNQFDIFPTYRVATNGSSWGLGAQQVYMSCGYLATCTGYPTFQLFDVGVGADVAGAAITCTGNSTAQNNTQVGLIPSHTYTIRTSVAATGCNASTNFLFQVTVDQIW